MAKSKKETVEETAVATTEPNALAELGFSADDMDEFGVDASEVLDRSEQRIPFIKILQDNSPEVKQKGSGYVEGAEPGMFYNTGSGELFDEIVVMICARVPSYKAWPKERTAGVPPRVYAEDDPYIQKLKADNPQDLKYMDKGEDGTIMEVSRAVDLAVLVLDPTGENAIDEVTISITSKKIKPYMDHINRIGRAKNLFPMNKTTGKRPALPVMCYRTVIRSKYEEKGQYSWFNAAFSFFTPEGGDKSSILSSIVRPSENRPLLNMAKALATAVDDGVKKIEHEWEAAGASNNVSDENAIDAEFDDAPPVM